MIKRYELEDRDWEQIKDLVGAQRHTGRPRRNDRELLNGMFWVLRSGAPWRDMPERYGPWQTVYDRFNRWRKDDTFEADRRAVAESTARGRADRPRTLVGR